jgi:methylmalonyl-CoA epimerase
MIKRIAHVGVATQSIAVAGEFYNHLGLEFNSVEVVEDQKVKVAILEVGDSAIELIEATQEDSLIKRFMDKRGPGLHHMTLEVDNLEEQLAFLREKDIKLIDEKPRQGAAGSLIAFVHPDSTGGVLIELSQPAPEGLS